MLSERSQTKKSHNLMIPFIVNVQNRQIHRDKSRFSNCQGLEWSDLGRQ